MHHRPFRVLCLALALSCGGSKPPADSAVAEAPPEPGTLGREVWDAMDHQADPCGDFYQFACGGWLASTPLPSDRPAYGRGFSAVDERNQGVLRKVVEDAVAQPSTPVRQRVADFWKACQDTAAIDAAGVQPVMPSWKRVDELTDRAGLMRLVGSFHADGLDLLFGVWVDGDNKNPDLAILHFHQGGTGLPERSYYLDESRADIRKAYQAYVEKLLGLAGVEAGAAKQQAADILAFETELAKLQWEAAKMGDATLTYNKVDLQGLPKDLDWPGYLAAAGGGGLTQINLMTPPYFEGLGPLVAKTDLAVLKAYLKFHLLSQRADDLAQPFEEARFDFYGRTLYGQQQQQDRWKRCLEKADEAIGDDLAQAYVEVAFPGDSKSIAQDMILRIEKAFEEGLPALGWMDEDTRARAVEKVRAITNKIGYPNAFRTYGFQVSATDHFGNVGRGAAATHAYWWGKVEKPVDPDQWLMTAPTVNAYYNPTQNEIVFPAGILQPPFFSATYPKAMNFGAMGLVMGHEITHGFDDEGRKFDGSGRMTDWWAPEAVGRFEESTACIQQQYDGYEVLPGVKVNGELTLGENIADLGGARVAYRAYRKWAEENGAEPELAGMKGEQLFWVAFAQSWCMVASPEYQKVLAATDPHSPAKFRVNGPLANLPEFAEAFRCEAGEPMRPKETCEVW